MRDEQDFDLQRGPRGEIEASGEVDEDNARIFSARLLDLAGESKGPLFLDFSALDLLDGPALARTVETLRGLLHGERRITLRGAPQMLAHNFYKLSLLYPESPLTLIEPRQDDPQGA